MIGSDPVRFRPMMIPAMLEKFIYVVNLSLLYSTGDLRSGQLVVVGPDLLLGALFVAAFLKTPAWGMAVSEKSSVSKKEAAKGGI